MLKIVPLNIGIYRRNGLNIFAISTMYTFVLNILYIRFHFQFRINFINIIIVVLSYYNANKM